MNPHRFAIVLLALSVLAGAVFGGEHTIFQGDGSDEPGFVPPPRTWTPPPQPPRSTSSAETSFMGGGGVTPQARTEVKRPPQPPVLFTKLRTRHVLDWCATPNDVNNLLKRMKSLADADYAMEVKSLAEVDPDPEKNPILYRSGHYHFSFTPQERAKLRQFMLDGGMVIFNTGLGSQPFYDSARKELETIFPEIPLQRLSSDHPVFHACHDLDRVKYRPGVYKAGYRGDEPWFDGITLDCRTLAVISRWGMAVGWEEQENDDYQAYASEDAQKLGVNLFSYASAQRAWAKQAASQMRFVDETPPSFDQMFLAQVVYDGEWKTRHAATSMLLHTFNLKTEMPVKFGMKELRLTDEGIFDSPALYLTGHEHFALSPAEIAQLRQYILSGGFLVAEACCGRKGFDLAFRETMAKALPEHPLTVVPETSAVFSLPNAVEHVAVTPALAAQLKRTVVRPALQGIDLGGRYAVLYSPYGMAGGWELCQSPYAHGYDSAGALRLGQNILLYAATR